jgi:hydroxyacylglutathione hydrolase
MEIKKITVGELATNCYLFTDAGEGIIIDPGDQAADILKAVKISGAKIKIIVNTHYHFDHTGANAELKTVLGAGVAIHESEKPFIEFMPDRWLKDGDIIAAGGVSLRVINTPGHTKGSVCLLGDGFVFSGDTVFDATVGRMDLPGGSAPDMQKSLQKLDQTLSEGATVYPGHGGIFKYKKGMAPDLF